MKRIINYKIEPEYENKTIEHYLKAKNFSHQVLVNLKKTQNGIILNDHWAYTNEKVKTGDILAIKLVETNNSSNIEAINIKLDIVYEDEDIIIINKPQDMAIHPSMGNHDSTLANALMYYFKSQNKDFVFRCVNRLDKDTTGLTIVAKHSLSAAILGKQITNRQIHRTYLAICEGKTNNNGIIEAPISRTQESTIERCVNFESGEFAKTNYSLIDYNSSLNLSLVKLQLETGRTHQIRVHMKYIGHPLIGDFLYNPNYNNIQRQALHSYSLDFYHPITNKKMNFICGLPSDMKLIFNSY